METILETKNIVGTTDNSTLSKDKNEKEEEKKPDRSRKRKPNSPSFVVEFGVGFSPSQRKKTHSRFNSSTIMYNACLREALDRTECMRTDERWSHARLLPKTVNKKPNREKTELFKMAKIDAKFDVYSLMSFGSALRVGWLRDTVGAQEAQAIARRAYTAVADWIYSGKGKPRYKSVARGLRSIECKDICGDMKFVIIPEKTTLNVDTGEIITNTPERYELVWSGVRAPLHVDLSNPVHTYGIKAAKKGLLYIRIVRKTIKNKEYFYAQFVCDGKPLQRYEIGEGKVGVDLGPSTIAVVSNGGVFLEKFCVELDLKQEERKTLQRRLDRQHRAGSPQCFDVQGRHKKGKCGWKRGKNAKKTITALAELSRTQAKYRKSLHGNLSNRILGVGKDIFVEKTSKKAWQKSRYGKSINFRAPGMLETLVCRKAESAGGKLTTIDTRVAKLSQRCVCGSIKKKSLSTRVHECECGIREQRDCWSAFLARHTDSSGVFYPLTAYRELSERYDIGVGRGNILPNLRILPAVKVQYGVTNSCFTTTNIVVSSSLERVVQNEHTSELIPSRSHRGWGDCREAKNRKALKEPRS